MPVAPGAYEQLHTNIRTRFNAEIGADLQVVFDNETELPDADSLWLTCNIQDTDTELAGTGGKMTYRKRGELRSTIRGPLGRGDGEMLRELDKIRAAFNRVVAAGVNYGVTSAGGYRRADQWWQIESVTPYYSDDIAARQDNVGAWALRDREAAANSVRSRFDGLFGSSGSESVNTVVYDNDPTKPPSDTQWVNFSITTGITEPVGAGDTAWARTFGIATAMILSPLGRGTKTTLVLADAIMTKFRSVTDNGVAYDTPYLSTVGRRGQWWQTNCNIRFRLEEAL